MACRVLRRCEIHSPMSEFTRAQIYRLIEHARDVVRQSQELRRKLEAVLKRIEETGSAEPPNKDHVARRKLKTSK